MSGDQVRQIIKNSDVSLAEVARRLSISPQSLNSRLNVADIGVSMLNEIANAINKNLYEILNIGEKPEHKQNRAASEQLSIVAVDTSDNIIIPLLDTKVAAGSPTLLDETDYYKELPVFSLPNFIFRGNLVVMQVRGESMFPTIKQGDYVIGQYVEELNQLRNGEVYIVIYQEDHTVRFTVKRCFYFQGDDSLTLQSDNVEHPDSAVGMASMLKLYHVQGCMTTQTNKLESPIASALARIERRIDRLENKVQK